MRIRGCLFVQCVVLILLSGCQASTTTYDLDQWLATPTTDVSLPTGYEASIVISDLQSPTQFTMGPANWLLIAQLAGGENAESGQILAVSPLDGEQIILFDELVKPTGLAYLEGHLWIVSGKNILRSTLSEELTTGKLETVLADLPFNGRSLSTLTVSPDNKLIFATSNDDNPAQPGPGTLWTLDPANPEELLPMSIQALAYAHTFDDEGQLWMTNVVNDVVENRIPPDTLNLVHDEADGLQCFGFEDSELPGSSELLPSACKVSQSAVALFPPHATPTSVVTSPWDDDKFFVALWLAGEVVEVSIEDGTPISGEVTIFTDTINNPQHLLSFADDSLLIGDFHSGNIYRVKQSE